jgi:putative redox protein
MNGTKRDETPATLDYVKIDMVIYNGNDEEKLKKAAELGAKYCSIHETDSKVSKVDLVVTFKNR